MSGRLAGKVALVRDGARERTVALPVSHPTSCAFGGPNLDELYVTRARRVLTPDERARPPMAGDLLRLRPGVVRRPAHVFGMAA